MIAVALAAGAVAWLQGPTADARPGGGQSYSGASSGDSGSSGSGSSDSYSSSSGSSGSSDSYGSSSSSGTVSGGPTDFSEPSVWVGPLTCALFVGFIYVLSNGAERASNKKGAWESEPQLLQPQNNGAPLAPAEVLEKLLPDDPDFSLVLFEDFVYGLYAAAQRARHDRDALLSLRSYLGEDARRQLRGREPIGAPVAAVVIGAARVLALRERSEGGHVRRQVLVEFESNVISDAREGQVTRYVVERWRLERASSARTRPWTGARTFGCPSCGAPLGHGASPLCESCGNAVDGGRFDWVVTDTELVTVQRRPPSLTGSVEERGTYDRTVLQPGLGAALARLTTADPAVTAAGLTARTELIFHELQRAWAAQDLAGVRPFVSDSLLGYLQYWVDAYRALGLRNAVEGARVTKQEIARVVGDRHYDAVTVRVWATGHEVTTEAATGKVVSGSREKERAYSEYWTLIRGSAVRGAPRTDRGCPACGAPLGINMAGSCDHCGSHVTSGEFDWVLSRIEQDDSYTG